MVQAQDGTIIDASSSSRIQRIPEGSTVYVTNNKKYELLPVPEAEDNERLEASTMETLQRNAGRQVGEILSSGRNVVDSTAQAMRNISDATVQAMHNAGDTLVQTVKDAKEEPHTPVNPQGTTAKKKQTPKPKAKTTSSSTKAKVAATTTTAAAATPAAPQGRRRDGSSYATAPATDEWSLGDGISSLDNEINSTPKHEDHLYKVKFTKDQKVTSGERITIRLLEDLPLEGNIIIPKNTHLSAVITIGRRLQISVTTIEIGGMAHNIGYKAVDVDGTEGLYCPSSKGEQTVKQAGQQLSNIGRSALSTGITGLSNTMTQIVNSGAQLIASASGEQTVLLTSGYEFFIRKGKK